MQPYLYLRYMERELPPAPSEDSREGGQRRYKNVKQVSSEHDVGQSTDG